MFARDSLLLLAFLLLTATQRASFFPTLSLGASYMKFSQSGYSFHTWELEPSLQLDFLFHVTSHFFVGAGPAIDYRYISGANEPTYLEIGVGTIIGGSF